MAVSVQPFHLLGKRKPIVRTLSGRCCVRLGARSSSVHVPPSIPIYFLIAACTILSVNPTSALHAATAKPRSPRRSGPDGTVRPSREPRSRQRETDLAQSEKRTPFPSQSVGLPPRAGARGGRRLPLHSTRPGLPQGSAVRLAMRRSGLLSATFRMKSTASLVRRSTMVGVARIRSSGSIGKSGMDH
jgi:hypothetical protein